MCRPGRSALERLQARPGPAPAGRRRRLASPLAHVRGAKWPHCILCPDRPTFSSRLSPSRLSCSDVPFFMRSPPSSPGAINHRPGRGYVLAGLTAPIADTRCEMRRAHQPGGRWLGPLCQAELKPFYFVLSCPQTRSCFAGARSSSGSSSLAPSHSRPTHGHA